MLVLTVQRWDIIRKIYSGEYKPDFGMSRYAFLSPNHTKAYSMVLSALSIKTKRAFICGKDSCLWGWVKSPYYDFYPSNKGKPQDEKLYALICDVPEEDMVLSDYDKFCNYLEGNEKSNFMVSSLRSADCIQCSFWSLSKEQIVGILDIDLLKNSELSYDLLIGNKSRCKRVERLLA